MGFLPAGALGVALHSQLADPAAAVFIERPGSLSGRALRAAGGVWVERAGERSFLDLRERFLPGLAAAGASGLPEMVLVCTNPDQLVPVLQDYVALITALAGDPQGDWVEAAPVLILCANGIYFQRLRQVLVELLEEGTLLGRLPDLWPDLMPRLVARLLRGVTIQTGLREGSGAEAVYRPGPPGLTRLAGGGTEIRAACVRRLAGLGLRVEDAGHLAPTRVEFDKAIVNLVSNFLGLIWGIDDRGGFRPLTVGEIYAEAHWPAITELAGAVLAVGRRVRAYRHETLEDLMALLRSTSVVHAPHVPSSIQRVENALARGVLRPGLPPTEVWLVEPLIKFARSSGLDAEAAYFESLKSRLEDRIAAACG
ncbi:MAG: hypothetical protein EA425_02090 [Puniceicoccaceae bacterium]|nr:MAG: hypothetical protein EA425_02090 [Puniceicoccaceae bacterium]